MTAQSQSGGDGRMLVILRATACYESNASAINFCLNPATS
jgi:hypothetical protein